MLFSEVTEVRDAAALLTARSANRDVANELIAQLRWNDEYLGKGWSDRSANPTPGNKAGGRRLRECKVGDSEAQASLHAG